jgi:predicted AAA+ superfamily ATPase
VAPVDAAGILEALASLLQDRLQAYLNVRITPGETLLFFDEIQECSAAITALRYFYEKLPELHIVAAGSLLEFELQKIGLPVGRVQFLNLHPLSFREFLVAQGEDLLLEEIHNLRTKQAVSAAAQQRLLEQVKTYCLIGGMPEVVATYIESRSLPVCRQVQSEIIIAYRQDFLKYTKDSRLNEVRTVFEAVPREIGNKIKYSNLNRDIRSTYLAEALQLLCQASVVRKVCHTSANGVPLGAEVDPRCFKCIFVDIGLAVRLLGLDLAAVHSIGDLELINRGALAEQFVGQELLAAAPSNEEPLLYYWKREAENSNAEVDYITAHGSQVIPIEVKAGATGRLRSLHLFLSQKPHHNKGVRIYAGVYRREGKLLHLPFYAVSVLAELIEE